MRHGKASKNIKMMVKNAQGIIVNKAKNNKHQKQKTKNKKHGTPERFRLPPHKLISGEKNMYC